MSERQLPGTSALEVALSVLVAQRGHLRIAQVGANDGRTGDPLHAFVMAHADSTSCLLVEPQAQLLPMLTDSYDGHPDAVIVNMAVGDPGVLTLYGVDPRAWPELHVPYATGWPTYRAPTGIVSADAESVRAWIAQHYQGDRIPDDVLESFSVSSAPLPVILRDHGWDRVDVLQIDVEGFDDEVIYSSDLPRLRPWLINYEHDHLSAARARTCRDYLTDAGYLCVEGERDTLAMLQP